MIRFGYVQSGVQRFAEWTEELGLVCEDDLLDAVNLLIGANAPVRCSWVGYFMEASLDTAVQAWGTINAGLRWCSGIDLVRCTPPLIEYDEFSDPEEGLFEKAMSRSEAGKIAADARWKNHVKASVANSIIDRVKAYGGLSVKMLTGEEPTSGYMVAQRGHNREVPSADFFDPAKGQAILKKYLIEKRDVFGKEQYLGLWYDSANDEVVLDVVDNIQKKSDATREGAERNQQAIWDVKGQREISTGGSGDRESEPAIDVNKTAGSVIGDGRRRDWAFRQRYLGEVYGDTQALIEFDKAKFSSRSEAGKYAAHIRWMNQRGMTPMTVDQWKSQNTGGSERMRKIQELQMDVSERLRKFNILLGKSHVFQDGIWNSYAESKRGQGTNKVLLVQPEDWEKTEIPSKGTPAQLWAVEVPTSINDFDYKVAVPNAEVMRLMEDVKTLGGLIEDEALGRANASSSEVIDPVVSTMEFKRKITGLQQEIKNNEWLMHYGMKSLVNFLGDPDNEKTKFEEWVDSGLPSKISASQNAVSEFGEFGEKTVQDIIDKYDVRDFDKFVDVMNNEILSSQTAVSEAGFDQNSLAKYRREVLREIRPHSTDEGMHNEIITGNPKDSGTALESHVAKAMRLLPSAWVEKLKNYTKQHNAQGKMSITPAVEGRSGYSEPHHFIQTSTDAQPMTLVHELIHAVEASNPAMRVMVNSFHINRRFGNFRADDEKFGSTFSKRLRGKYEEEKNGFVEDSYADKYSGREYPSYELIAREQLTTGTDMSLFVNNMRTHGLIDSDQLNFTLGMWASA
jgi:hypothetical protein